MLKKYEKTALDTFLENYPKNKDFFFILKLISDEEYEISFDWQIAPKNLFKKWSGETLQSEIHDLAVKLRMIYGDS